MDYQKNKFKEAIKAYEKVIEIEPNNNWAHYNMGLAYYGLGKFKKAIEAYEKAIDIKPDEEAYHNMGIAYIMLNEKVSFEDAIKAYEKAIEINPDYDTAYYNLLKLAFMIILITF
jgi:superkiller protein 3